LRYRSVLTVREMLLGISTSLALSQGLAFAQPSEPGRPQPPAAEPPTASAPAQPPAAAPDAAPSTPTAPIPDTAPSVPEGQTGPTAPSPQEAAGTTEPALAEPSEVEASEEGALQQITVKGKRLKLIEAGPLGTRSVLETPFSVGTADSEQISRIAATTIDSALGYDASIRSNNSGVASGNTFAVRGQSVDRTNGYKFDGLAFPYWFQDQPVESLSEIQVLKGAGGFVYGYASPSGIVNFVSKKPTADFQANVNLSLRSSNIWRVHLDVGGPVVEGKSLAFRLNAVQEEGTLYNGAKNRNQFVTLWLQGDITPKLTWSVDGFYQRTWQSKQSNSISLGPNVTHLKPVSGTLNLGADSTTKWNDMAQVTGRLNYEINQNWHATAALRYSALDERFPGNTVQLVDDAGNYNFGILNMNRLFHYYVGQASIDGKFSTGPIDHEVVAGFDYLDVDFDYDYQPYTANGVPTATFDFGFSGNLYSSAVPDWGKDPAVLAFQRPPDWFRYQEIQQRGVYVSDTARLGAVELMGGLRYTSYKEFNYQPVQEDTKYSENSVTPVAALSLDVAEGVRIYASYVQALQRGTQAPTNAVNSGETFGPLKSTQVEAGVKAQRKQWGASLAAFRTEVPSEYLESPAEGETLGRWVRNGERRYQGVEFEGRLQPTREWLLNVSTAYLDAKQTKGAANIVGKKVPGTTVFQASGLLQYSPSYIPGFRMFGGLRYSGRAYGQAQNTFIFPVATVGDVGVGYVTALDAGEIQLQGNVSNVGDTRYWVPNTETGAGLSAGAPRTFSVSLGWSPDAKGATVGRGHGEDAEFAARSPIARRHWYLGLEAGVLKLLGSNYDAESRLDPSIRPVRDVVDVKHDPGLEIGGTLGYDFGLFRSELQVSRSTADLSRVRINSAEIPIDDQGSPAGNYKDPGGATRVLSFLLNGLFDLGGDEHTPWAVQGGFGVGFARVTSTRWSLEDSGAAFFQNDDPIAFAWQATAGVRRRLTDHIDMTLKYRYFDVPTLKFFTMNANRIDGKLSSHSVLIGANLNF